LLEPGALLRSYRIGRVLGTGGMGAVYEATDEANGRAVVVKVLLPELATIEEFVDRMRREARAISALRHPNVVELIDFAVEGNLAFMVMERLIGETLGERVRRDAPLPVTPVVQVAREVLSALSAAHAAGLVHRDVKPDNVFLARRNDGVETAKLLDFGIVKSLHAVSKKLTASQSVLGTFQYMAPEQARGEDIDASADLYSLGATLYFALTGMRPNQSVGLDASTFAFATTKARPIAELRPDLPPAVAETIDRALEKDRHARFASASSMSRSFEPPDSGTIPMTSPPVRLVSVPASMPMTAPQTTKTSPPRDTTRDPVEDVGSSTFGESTLQPTRVQSYGQVAASPAVPSATLQAAVGAIAHPHERAVLVTSARPGAPPAITPVAAPTPLPAPAPIAPLPATEEPGDRRRWLIAAILGVLLFLAGLFGGRMLWR
jgi:serine/threonine protein kinase